MSKKPKSKTKTWDSENLYAREALHNDRLAMEWLKIAFPEFAELKRVMKTFDVTFEDLLDFIYNVRTVRNHGWGNVTILIQNGQITKIDSILRTIRRVEEEKTLPKNR